MATRSKWAFVFRRWVLFIPFPFLPVRGWSALCPVVLYKPGKLDDALLEHEFVHCQQCLRGFWVWWWLQYVFSKQRRYEFERDAYRLSVLHGRSLESAGRALYSNYGKAIGMRYEQCKDDLTVVFAP